MPLTQLRPLDDLEQELRERLRGRRIVFEMGLDSDTVECAREAPAAWSRFGHRRICARGARRVVPRRPECTLVAGSRYPAVLLTYGEGPASQ